MEFIPVLQLSLQVRDVNCNVSCCYKFNLYLIK